MGLGKMGLAKHVLYRPKDSHLLSHNGSGICYPRNGVLPAVLFLLGEPSGGDALQPQMAL